MGSGVISIGNYKAFNILFVYENGGGTTVVTVSIDGAKPIPLQPGQYPWSANDTIVIDYVVDPIHRPQFVWIFQ